MLFKPQTGIWSFLMEVTDCAIFSKKKDVE